MKRKNLILGLVAAVVFSCGISFTAFAAEESRETFNYTDYADRYPDLKAVFGYDLDALYNHYISFGKNEGRTASFGEIGIQAEEAKTPVQQKPYTMKTRDFWGVLTYDICDIATGVGYMDLYGNPVQIIKDDEYSTTIKTYEYDEMGNVTREVYQHIDKGADKQTDKETSYRYKYDAQGKMKSKIEDHGWTQYGCEYQYDDRGNISSEVKDEGWRTVTYLAAYNDRNQIVKYICNDTGEYVELEYDENGFLKRSFEHYNEKGLKAAYVEGEYTCDSHGTPITCKKEYRYNDSDNFMNRKLNLKWDIQYDELGRVVSITESGDATTKLDGLTDKLSTEKISFIY